MRTEVKYVVFLARTWVRKIQDHSGTKAVFTPPYSAGTVHMARFAVDFLKSFLSHEASVQLITTTHQENKNDHVRNEALNDAQILSQVRVTGRVDRETAREMQSRLMSNNQSLQITSSLTTHTHGAERRSEWVKSCSAPKDTQCDNLNALPNFVARVLFVLAVCVPSFLL